LDVAPTDHVAISNLLARYCMTQDLEDVDGWVDLFLPDARFEVFGRSFDGHEGLRRMMDAAPAGLHLGGLPVIEMVDRDLARTTRNLLFVDRSTGACRQAVYIDELCRTNDGWRISKCRCRFIVADGLSDRPAR
jgi:hypothetical protein